MVECQTVLVPILCIEFHAQAARGVVVGRGNGHAVDSYKVRRGPWEGEKGSKQEVADAKGDMESTRNGEWAPVSRAYKDTAY